jgi:hypothetical protein
LTWPDQCRRCFLLSKFRGVPSPSRFGKGVHQSSLFCLIMSSIHNNHRSMTSCPSCRVCESSLIYFVHRREYRLRAPARLMAENISLMSQCLQRSTTFNVRILAVSSCNHRQSTSWPAVSRGIEAVNAAHRIAKHAGCRQMQPSPRLETIQVSILNGVFEDCDPSSQGIPLLDQGSKTVLLGRSPCGILFTLSVTPVSPFLNARRGC